MLTHHTVLGITQKSAWFMLHRIRKACGNYQNSLPKLSNIVEADEAFIGGKEGNKHFDKKNKESRGRSTIVKTSVIGLIESKANIKAFVMKELSQSSIHKVVKDNVEFGSKLMTDEYDGYNGLEKYYTRKFIIHSSKQYVDGDVYTNTMEGYWSLLKRAILGVYHSVSRKHLQRYVDESSFRYNTKNMKVSHKFLLLLCNCDSWLSYKRLI